MSHFIGQEFNGNSVEFQKERIKMLLTVHSLHLFIFKHYYASAVERALISFKMSAQHLYSYIVKNYKKKNTLKDSATFVSLLNK